MNERVQASDATEDLTTAVRWGNLGVLQSLLESGADPNILNRCGCTALHVAAESGQTECAIVLINHKGLFNCELDSA